MRSLLFLLAAVLLTASPTLAQVGILWDVAPFLNAEFVRTSSDGTVTVAGNPNGPTDGGATVARLSAAGATLWSTSLAPGIVRAMALGPDGSAYVLLRVRPGPPTYDDIGVVRIGPDGAVAWRRDYDGTNSGGANNSLQYDVPIDLAVDGQGNVFTTGTDGSANDALLAWSMMHSAAGTLLWSRTYSYTADGAAISLPKRAGMDCAGNAYVMGEVRSGRRTRDPGFLISYAPDGTVRQQAILNAASGGSISDSKTYFHDFAVACDGTAYVAGVESVTRNAPDVSTQTAFAARFDAGSSTPAWTAAPFGNQSGAALTTTGGHVNLALGGPDAVYVQAATYAENTTTGFVRTVRLGADGAQAWSDEGPVGAQLQSKRIAADASGVVVVANVRLEPTVVAARYRRLTSAGVEAWSVQRPGLMRVTEANTMVTYPGGGAVWSEGAGHVLRVGEPPAEAEVQVVHASAAIAALGPIQVYLNQPVTSTTPDATVSFRGGSAFVTVPAGQPLSVRVRPVTAPPAPLPREVSFTAPPLPDGGYVVSLAGIPAEIQAFFAANPGGIPRDLRLILAALGLGRSASGDAFGGGVPVVVTHAVTDAAAIDVVVAETGQVLADDLPYGQAAPPTTLAAGTYRVEVRNAATGALVAAVRFVLDGTEGSFALTATGFLNPAANQNGPALALTATDETGTTDTGVIVTGTDEAGAGGLALTVANPVRGAGVVRYALAEAAAVRLAVVDALGREVAVLADGAQAAGPHEARLDASALAPGVYVLRLTAGPAAAARTVTVVR